MKNKNLLIVGSSLCLLFTLLFGCGDRSGEKDYNKAMVSWKNGDLSRAQGQMEKAIRKLSDKEKKSMANNQLGLILWNLGKNKQAAEKFGESCRLAEELTGANLNRGIALYHTGEMDSAGIEFTKILLEQPDNSTARSFMGLIHLQKKNWTTASSEIAKGLKTNPSDPAGQNAYALAQLHTSNGSDAAIARLKKLMTTHPDYAPAAYNLAVIYDQWLRNNSAARGWYKIYLQKAGENGAQLNAAKQAIARLDGPARQPGQTHSGIAAQHIAAGSKLHAEEKYREAIAQYQKAIQADPSKATAHYNMGLSLYKLKQYSQTATACENALKLDPNSSNARYMLALSCAKQGKWSKAEREANLLKRTDAVRGESMLKYISDARNQ